MLPWVEAAETSGPSQAW